MTSFDLEDVDLGSPNLHHKEFLCGPTHPQSFVFLAFLGAEIAGGGAEYAPPPSRARNSQTLSRGRVKRQRTGAAPEPAFSAVNAKACNVVVSLDCAKKRTGKQ